MDNFIFNPKQDNEQISEYNNTYYCIKDQEDFIDEEGYPRSNNDSKKVLAKKIIKRESQPQYYIKISNNNKLFNPLSSGLEEKSYSIVDNVCRPSDKFRSVNNKVFMLYLSFLMSKNITWLTKAEREII